MAWKISYLHSMTRPCPEEIVSRTKKIEEKKGRNVILWIFIAYLIRIAPNKDVVSSIDGQLCLRGVVGWMLLWVIGVSGQVDPTPGRQSSWWFFNQESIFSKPCILKKAVRSKYSNYCKSWCVLGEPVRTNITFLINFLLSQGLQRHLQNFQKN